MANEIDCNPPCFPNTAGSMGVIPPSVSGTPLPEFPVIVEICENGVLSDQTRPATQTVQVLWPKDMVMKVRDCASEFDHYILCAPNGDRVIAVVSYGATGVPGTVYYTPAGTIYAGNLALLASCGTSLESDELAWCASGVNYTQWIEKDAGQPTGVTYWTNETGAVVSAPTGAVRGICILERQALVYVQQNLSVVTMADIVAASGASRIQSITVKQISGIGEITGDSGSGTPMDSGETWSWSAHSLQTFDHLTVSTLSMTANGEQRITAIYFV